MSNHATERLCVHIDNADGQDVLVALAPAGKTEDQVKADVADAVAADKSEGGDYAGIFTVLHDRGYSVYRNFLSFGIDY